METEEANGGEFQEKAGLKRKLTGPPRLLLGKSKSAGQDEKKSDAQALRKQRRDKNNGTPKHTAEEHQGNNDAGCESQQVMCQSPPTGLAGEEAETQTELQEESLETKSAKSSVKRQHGKSRLRRSIRAKATIQRVFSPAFACIRRRKQLDIKAVEDAGDSAPLEAPSHQDTASTRERLTISGDTFNMTDKCEIDSLKKSESSTRKRKFHIRIWPIFKRRSVPPNGNQRQGHGNDTFIEITSEKDVERNSSAVDQPDYCTPEPSGDPAVEEQLNGSSEIHDDMAGVHEESCPGKDLGQKEERTEIVILSAEESVDLDTMFSHEKVEQLCCSEPDEHKELFPNVNNEEDTRIQVIEVPEPTALLDSTCVNECNFGNKVPGPPDIALTNDLDKIVPFRIEEKCRPVIMIEDVHSSDEEIQEPMTNEAPQHGTLSPLVSLNGSCHHFKVKNVSKNRSQTFDQSDHSGQFSEILLVQTAFSLVSAAISSAMEQLSAELQSNQIDQDHA